MKMKCEWSRHHGRLWLAFSAQGRTYEIPFDDQRFVAGAVLFWDGSSPPLVKGMMSPDLVVNDDLRTLCPEADLEIERHQAVVKIRLGVALDRVRPEDAVEDYPVGLADPLPPI